jgi:P27 family predicted phage terminase small subunit
VTTEKGGRRRTPTALKLLKGETRESRLNRSAPKPTGSRPAMPRGMSQRSRAVWRRQTRAMAKTGVLTVVDSDALRAYCDAVARYEEAEAKYHELGPLVEGARSGELVKNPLHQVVRDNAMLMARLATLLAFVPSAREGITVDQPDAPADSLSTWEAGSG